MLDPLCSLGTGKWVLWQKVKTQMKCRRMHCLLGQNRYSAEEIQYYLKIITCDPLIIYNEPSQVCCTKPRKNPFVHNGFSRHTRKTYPFITERLLMGRKESSQTNKQTYHIHAHFTLNNHISLQQIFHENIQFFEHIVAQTMFSCTPGLKVIKLFHAHFN